MSTVNLAIAKADEHPRVEAAILIALGLAVGLAAASAGLRPWVRLIRDAL